MTDVTHILSKIELGDPSAAEQLLPLVYDELRKLAAAKLVHEKPGQTLQATALVHDLKEDPLKVVDRDNPKSPEFLRPKRNSVLATGGAGRDLSKYVGAALPQGVKPWNWDVTWRSRMSRERYASSNSASENNQTP